MSGGRPLFGAHMSVAGGLPRAVERAVVHRCDALQVFTKNANQWRGRPLPPEEIREFRARVKAAAIRPVVSHASYLINLATTDAALHRQSRDQQIIVFSCRQRAFAKLGGHALTMVDWSPS